MVGWQSESFGKVLLVDWRAVKNSVFRESKLQFYVRVGKIAILRSMEEDRNITSELARSQYYVQRSKIVILRPS